MLSEGAPRGVKLGLQPSCQIVETMRGNETREHASANQHDVRGETATRTRCGQARSHTRIQVAQCTDASITGRSRRLSKYIFRKNLPWSSTKKHKNMRILTSESVSHFLREADEQGGRRHHDIVVRSGQMCLIADEGVGNKEHDVPNLPVLAP